MNAGVNASPQPLLASAVGPIPVKVLDNAGSGRVDAVIQNLGPGSVRLGGADVSFGNPETGVELVPPDGSAAQSLTWPYGGALYAVCGAGESAVLAGFDVR